MGDLLISRAFLRFWSIPEEFNRLYWGQRSTTQKQMWRRKKPTQPSETESKQESNGVCMNCIKLLQENSQLKEQLAVLQGEGKRKQYTIAPTLYTFYKNNVQKNRISR